MIAARVRDERVCVTGVRASRCSGACPGVNARLARGICIVSHVSPALCLVRQALARQEQVYLPSSIFRSQRQIPLRCITHHRIQDGDQFPHASDRRDFRWLSLGAEPFVQLGDLRIVGRSDCRGHI